MAVENENKLSEIIQAFADAGFINDVILLVLGALALMTKLSCKPEFHIANKMCARLV